MTECGTESAESLLETIGSGRTFGAHPLWFKIQQGRLSLQAVCGFAGQFLPQVVEFPWWQFFDEMDRAHGAEVRA